MNAKDHAHLDQLRQLRHDVNYPADIVAPSARELKAVAALVERVVEASAGLIPAPKIPPPRR